MKRRFLTARPAPRAAAAIPMVVVMVMGVMASDAAAGQAAVRCGSVITTNTTLTDDVGPCPGIGLVVAADNVTLDLGGHTVSGDPERRGSGPDAPGVLLRQIHGSRVLKGTVRGFDAGVVIAGGAGNTVTGITARDNLNYRLVTGRNALPEDIDPDQGPFCDLGDGIAVVSSNDNTLVHNVVLHNGPYSGMALVGPSNRNRLVGNEVADNDVLNQPPSGVHGTICGGLAEIGDLGRWPQDVGVRIEGPGAQHNVVQGNRVVRSSLAGIMVTAFVNAFPMANNGFNQVSGNTISQTGLRTHHLNDFGDEYRSSGIYLHNAGATEVSLSYGNVIAGNDSSNNFGGGIEVLGPFPGSGEVGVGGNTITGNRADDNLLDGIILAEGTIDTTVSGNTAHGNAPDRSLLAAINARDPYTVWAGVDGADNNPGCDHNRWARNSFGTVNRPCVKANGGTGQVLGPLPPAGLSAAGMAIAFPPTPDRTLRRRGPSGVAAQRFATYPVRT